MRRVGALLEALEQQVVIAETFDAALLELASPCAGWTVREVLNHSIGVTLKFAAFAAGDTDRPRAPNGDLVGDNHRAALRQAADSAIAAWTAADMHRVCHLSFGTFSAESAAGINLFDALAHTWDIASAVGVSFMCSADLWETGLDAAQEVIGRDRDRVHYDVEVDVGATASSRSRFLGYLGRHDRPCS